MAELTKEYFDSFVKALNIRLENIDKKFDVIDDKFETVFDGFKGLNDNLNQVAQDVKTIKVDLKELSDRDMEDSNAFAKELLSLNRRVSRLEKQTKPRVRHA